MLDYFTFFLQQFLQIKLTCLHIILFLLSPTHSPNVNRKQRRVKYAPFNAKMTPSITQLALRTRKSGAKMPSYSIAALFSLHWAKLIYFTLLALFRTNKHLDCFFCSREGARRFQLHHSPAKVECQVTMQILRLDAR